MPRIGHTPEELEAFVSQFLRPKKTIAQMLQVRKEAKKSESGVYQMRFPRREEDVVALKKRLIYRKNTSPMIYICGHGSRDTRCGILGPILRADFQAYVDGINRMPADEENVTTGIRFKGFESVGQTMYTKIAMTSHIGGHAFAGNVIVYLPKKYMLPNGKMSPLAGMGIWYGRVEPKHVWGIMEETVQRGCVIEELLRGIHKPYDIGG